MRADSWERVLLKMDVRGFVICKDSEWGSEDIYVKVFPTHVIASASRSVWEYLFNWIVLSLQIVLSVDFLVARQKCLPDWHMYVSQCICSCESRQMSMLCSVHPRYFFFCGVHSRTTVGIFFCY